MKSKAIFLTGLGSLFLVACGTFFPFDRSPRGMGPNFGNRRSGYETNGEQIYFTALNDRGEYIQYKGGLHSAG